MSAKKSAATVFQLFNRRPAVRGQAEEIQVGLPRAFARVAETRPTPTEAIDLSGKPKVLFAIGPGRAGKTMLLRWAIEEMQASGAQAICAAADPQNRSLTRYFDGVAEPPSNDAADVTQWLMELLQFVGEEKTSALIDLGGGDTSLGRLLDQTPDLGSVMEESGVAPVAVYLLGPRVDDLASLASFEAAGFQPPATALVLNEGLTHAGSVDPFGSIVTHSVYRAAVERGAVELRMPKLAPDLAQEIDVKRLSFSQAAAGKAPEGRRVEPVGPFKRSTVRKWLIAMNEELVPIRSWLPT